MYPLALGPEMLSAQRQRNFNLGIGEPGIWSEPQPRSICQTLQASTLHLQGQLPTCVAFSPQPWVFADGREPSAPAAVANTRFSAPLVQAEFSHVCVNWGGKKPDICGHLHGCELGAG